ncbi:sulfite exporter TauE/SafE family protein [Persephonella atlantica]|uniref:Probable membrane transporter protein n=1 Tax=Persephonella atlantica TaxID=2699429 RepID=A0ABS1GID1_9AQUI|nr:sulfite exporter TauE/SafE family protein [Persephonella atlantica]MBK3332693.1 sulfite exporter TauE/SafE family protein [Persephonella atlantica]
MELLVLGLTLGLVIGITGIGGGMLTTPALTLLMGVPIASAVGTSLLFSAITKIFASAIYIYRGLVCVRLSTLLALGSIPGSLFGSFSFHYFFKINAELASKVVSVFVLVMIVSSCCFSYYRMFTKNEKIVNFDIRSKPLWIPVIGFIVGFDIGFTSIGAGVIVASILLALCPMNPSRIIGTDIVHGFILSLFAGGIHFSMGGVDTDILIGLLYGGIFGVILGSLISPYLPQKPFRFALNSAVLVFAFMFAFKVFGV